MHLMGLVPEANGIKKEPVVIHNCKEKPIEDELIVWIKENDIFSRLQRWTVRLRILSPSNYYAKTCLKSTPAIRNEINNQLKKHPHMIHPFSPFKIFWDIFMFISTYAALLITPFINTFSFEKRNDKIVWMLIIDIIFITDIVIQFFTGYYEKQTSTVDLDPKIVCRKYIGGYFIFDLLSSFPLEAFDLMFNRTTKELLSWYCTTFNFFKICRLRNMVLCFQRLLQTYRVKFIHSKVLMLVMFYTIIIHWASCIVYYVPMIVNKISGNIGGDSKSWIDHDIMKSHTQIWRKYILCLNRATISLVSSCHYLGVVSVEDKILNFVLAVIGKIGYIYLLSQFLQILSVCHSTDKGRLKLMQQLEEYMRYKELPRSTQKRLLTYCNYWYKKNFNRDKHILGQVSKPLRQELILYNYMRLIQTVDLFRHLPHSAIVQLVNHIKPELYLVNDTIVKSGSHGDSLYFIGSGTVAVYTTLGKEVCHLEDGSYFGEIALLMRNEHRIATVVAIETCEILKVPREAFQQIIAPYPNLLSHLQKVGIERLEKTLLIDEVYKLENKNPCYINISTIKGSRRY